MALFDLPTSLTDTKDTVEDKDLELEEKELDTEVEEEEEDVLETGDDTEDDEEDDSIYGVFSGLALDVPEEEEFDRSPEGLQKMIDRNNENVRKKVSEEYESKIKQIRETYEGKTSFASLDPKNVSHAKHMIMSYYKDLGFSEAKINRQLNLLNSDELLIEEAEEAQEKLVARENQIKERQEKEAQEAEKARAKQIEEEVNLIKSSIESTEEVAGFQITPKMRKQFNSFIFDRDDNGKTAYNKMFEDPKKMVEALFLAFVGYNKKDLLKTATTEVTKASVKKKSRFNNSATSKKGKTSKPSKSTKYVSVSELVNK